MIKVLIELYYETKAVCSVLRILAHGNKTHLDFLNIHFFWWLLFLKVLK